MAKNLLDIFVGYIAYWAFGWGFAHGPGGNAFIGGSNFFLYDMDDEKHPRFFMEYVWAANAATIVSGALAERCHI